MAASKQPSTNLMKNFKSNPMIESGQYPSYSIGCLNANKQINTQREEATSLVAPRYTSQTRQGTNKAAMQPFASQYYVPTQKNSQTLPQKTNHGAVRRQSQQHSTTFSAGFNKTLVSQS